MEFLQPKRHEMDVIFILKSLKSWITTHDFVVNFEASLKKLFVVVASKVFNEFKCPFLVCVSESL